VRRRLIVGECPGRNGAPDGPLVGPGSGAFLDDLLARGGVPVAAFERVNVLDDHRGDWPRTEARMAGARIVLDLDDVDVVVALGRRAARALFGPAADRRPWFEVFDYGGLLAVVMPHPSGLVREWNDPANRERAAELLRELAGQEASWPATPTSS
jgi:uracil-DNA glycosylase